jgi:hypothetical protein
MYYEVEQAHLPTSLHRITNQNNTVVLSSAASPSLHHYIQIAKQNNPTPVSVVLLVIIPYGLVS